MYFEPEKDIAIKIIGPRPGERLEEPLWLKEENPQPTEYKKILKLKNIESKTLDGLLEKIMPVVKFNSEKKELFRNKEVLLRILRDEVPSLNEFYTKMEQEGTKQKLSAKVVL